MYMLNKNSLLLATFFAMQSISALSHPQEEKPKTKHRNSAPANFQVKDSPLSLIQEAINIARKISQDLTKISYSNKRPEENRGLNVLKKETLQLLTKEMIKATNNLKNNKDELQEKFNQLQNMDSIEQRNQIKRMNEEKIQDLQIAIGAEKFKSLINNNQTEQISAEYQAVVQQTVAVQGEQQAVVQQQGEQQQAVVQQQLAGGKDALLQSAVDASIPQASTQPQSTPLNSSIASDTRQHSAIISKIISHRIENFIHGSMPHSSGQEDQLNRIWISGFNGSSSDKSDGLNKAKFSGGTVGYERSISDAVIGASFSVVAGESKYSTSKFKSNNYITSLYAIVDINNWILSNTIFAGFGKTKVSREALENQTATAKPKNTILGAKTGLAYKIQKENHILVPSLGLIYSSLQQDAYSEHGAESQNLKVDKKHGALLTGSIALKYGYIFKKQTMNITPSIEIGASTDLVSKFSKIKAQWTMQDSKFFGLEARSKKQTSLFVTPSILARSEFMDLNLSYTFEKSKKTIHRIASLKLITKF